MRRNSNEWHPGYTFDRNYEEEDIVIKDPFLKDCYNVDATCEGECNQCNYRFTIKCGVTYNWENLSVTFSSTTTATRGLG